MYFIAFCYAPKAVPFLNLNTGVVFMIGAGLFLCLRMEQIHPSEKYADKQKSFGIGTTDEAFTEVFGSDNPDFDG